MKKGAEILGLPIISITEGRELGMSKTLVIDAKNGLVAAVTVEDEEWYRGVKLIPYKFIIAIGEDAITILHSDNILTLGKIGEYEPLLVENIKILETKAITKSGKILGRISDIVVGDDGKIEKCEIRANDGSLSEVSADKVSIFSRQVTVIDTDGVKKIPPVVKPVERVAEVVKTVETFQPVAEIPKVEEVKTAVEIPPVQEINRVEEIQPVVEIPTIEDDKPIEEIETAPEIEIKPAAEIPDVATVQPAEEMPAVADIPTVEDTKSVEEIKPEEMQIAAEIPNVADIQPAEEIQTAPEIPISDISAVEEIQPIADFPTSENEIDESAEEEVEMPDMSDFEPEPAAVPEPTPIPEPIPEPEPVPEPELPVRGIQQAEVLKAALRRVTENQQRNATSDAKSETKKGGKTVTLVGRKVSKTITADNGTVIIEAGEEITDEVLKKARMAKKFIELSMNSIA